MTVEPDVDECIHGLGPIAACVICNGRAVREHQERWTVEHWFAARYSGRCVRCGEPFHPGDRIGVTVASEYVCGQHEPSTGE